MSRPKNVCELQGVKITYKVYKFKKSNKYFLINRVDYIVFFCNEER